IVRVGLRVLGRLAGERLQLLTADRDVERARDLLGDLSLHLEEIGEPRVVPLGPETALVAHTDQARDHPGAWSAAGCVPADAPREHVVHAQLAADLAERPVRLPVLARARAGDDAEVAE